MYQPQNINNCEHEIEVTEKKIRATLFTFREVETPQYGQLSSIKSLGTQHINTPESVSVVTARVEHTVRY